MLTWTCLIFAVNGVVFFSNSNACFFFLFLEYRDLDALVAEFAKDKVEGMLLDVFIAKYVINNDWRNYSDSIRFERVKILDRPLSIGFVFIPKLKEENRLLETCVKQGSSEYFETDIYTIAYNYVRPELNVSTTTLKEWKTGQKIISS